ncbi:putative signal transduction response regulator, reiver domain [Candidatus Nitrosocosmicus arcticus]|uniref:Putative signal transduction response regulator, reiver domain n=2 Tax=Candidatus Nitrosocosmicus arcticus TaxID=2035267 RepID=A0A557SVP4_9ARCH|nr:putative signal transduction response regulator, reiver domain [Candidatus Nitrosocosmicus arcticus]
MSGSSSVMVVEDEKELASLFKAFVEKMGYDAVSFTDPLIALEFFKQSTKEFSLILTDLRMPEMSGIELAAEIRKLNDKIKIILITAFMVDDLILSESYKAAKINEIVQKPVKIAELREIISMVLQE